MTAKYGKAPRRPTVMVLARNRARAKDLTMLARISGCALIDWDTDQPSDFVLVDLSSEMETLADILSEIVGYLLRHRSTAVVWVDMERLATTFAVLPQGQCHFLIDASDVDAMPILAGALGRGGMDRLHDRDRPVEFGSLHRISDELAEFARALAKIAESDRPSTLTDKPVSFRPAPIGGFQPLPTRAAVNEAPVPFERIRELIRLRRQRKRFFDSGLFADPAWDILLDLKAAQLENQNVSVSSLCIAAAVPPTTALRWITAMTDSGMLIRRQDPEDARRVFIELSEDTSARIDDYFASVADRLVQII